MPGCQARKKQSTGSYGKIKKVIKYAGSKQFIAPWIISHFPEDYRRMTYLEPYFGSGAVFFHKAPSEIETINDMSGDVVNLFRQIRDNHDELIRLIRYTPWSRDEYRLSTQKAETDIENARRFLFRLWSSIGASTHRLNGMRVVIKNRWNGDINTFQRNIEEAIEMARQRLIPSAESVVQIENRDALSLIKQYDRSNVLMYLDPPYVKSTRAQGHSKIYEYEMTDEDHIKLLEVIKASKAKIIISGYGSGLYNKYLSDWKAAAKVTRDEAHVGKTEYVWMNYAPPSNYLFEIDI